MASIVKASEQNDARNIALAKAESGRSGRLDSLRPMLKSLSVGDALTLDDADLALWNEALPRIVAKVTNGYEIPKAERKHLSGIFSALQRTIRHEVTGDAQSQKVALQGHFVKVENITKYEVRRTK
jgi:hypothetical protein